MKFWVWTIAGVLIVTAGSTALFVWNPDLHQPPKKIEVQKLVVAPQDAPVAVADKNEVKLDNVPQMKEDKTTFTIRNEGKSELKLAQGKKSCTCVGMELDKESLQ